MTSFIFAAFLASLTVSLCSGEIAAGPRLGDAIAGDGCSEDGSGCSSGLGLLQVQAEGAKARKGREAKAVPASVSVPLASEPSAKLFDCKAFPQYCGHPLNCDVADAEVEVRNWDKVMAKDGPNLKTWCHLPEQPFATSLIQECLVNRNLAKSAEMVYQEQKESHALEADASYCFIVGHCSAGRLADNATVQDGVKMCDAKYGRKAWTEDFGNKDMEVSNWMSKKELRSKTGFHSAAAAHAFSKLACAMGNYHCDQVYCHVNFCSSDYYQKRYGCYATQEPNLEGICPQA